MKPLTKIQKSARGEECTFNLPVCNHNPETTVLCHAPHQNKGMGIKGPDTWAAYGCSSCHDEMDGRTGLFFIDDDLVSKRLQKSIAWYCAIRDTQSKLIEKGLMPK